MRSAVCPSCDADIEIGAMPFYGMRLECPVCDAALKIIWLDPVELDWWDYDDEEDENDIYRSDEEDEVDDFKEENHFTIISREYAEDIYSDIGDLGDEDIAADFFEDRELLDK